MTDDELLAAIEARLGTPRRMLIQLARAATAERDPGLPALPLAEALVESGVITSPQLVSIRFAHARQSGAAAAEPEPERGLAPQATTVDDDLLGGPF